MAIGPKKCVVIGAVGYLPWIFAGLIFQKIQSQTALFFLFIVVGLVGGLGAALLWIAQGSLISGYSESENEKSVNFGLFWTIFISSFIFGNFLGGNLIEGFGIVTFFFLMSLMGILSAVILCCKSLLIIRCFRYQDLRKLFTPDRGRRMNHTKFSQRRKF